jgi:DNA-binding Lrp family transcriptional regulator
MLDDIDLKILDILQGAGRTRRNDLAESVGLSLPSVSERLRKLEEHGVITGYHARVDHKRMGRLTLPVTTTPSLSMRTHSMRSWSVMPSRVTGHIC